MEVLDDEKPMLWFFGRKSLCSWQGGFSCQGVFPPGNLDVPLNHVRRRRYKLE